MPGVVSSGHSHRPTTKVSHKPFKSRKATKGQLRNAAKGTVWLAPACWAAVTSDRRDARPPARFAKAGLCQSKEKLRSFSARDAGLIVFV